jgi:hypothetical protein
LAELQETCPTLSRVGIVDVSNVTRKGEDGRLSRLQSVRDELDKLGLIPVLVADANLKYLIDDKEAYEQLLDEGLVSEVPARTQADLFIIEIARQLKSQGYLAYLITNDWWLSRCTYAECSLQFMFVRFGGADQLVLERPPGFDLWGV